MTIVLISSHRVRNCEELIAYAIGLKKTATSWEGQ